MAYPLPDFHISVNVWHYQNYGVWSAPPALGAPTSTLMAQCKVDHTGFIFGSIYGPVPTILLLVPKGSAVNSPNANEQKCDIIEYPAGTGRYYSIFAVDDVSKGYANEHRIVAASQLNYWAGWWPDPLP